MSNSFCPDCGSDCSQHLESCPECQFPLTLLLRANEGKLVLKGEELKSWHRISQLLRRNGLKIETQAVSSGSQHWWWAVPGVGLFIFLLTLVFGTSVANSIWPPPPIQHVPTLELAAKDEEEPEATDPSFLVEALKASRDQEPDEEEIDPYEIIDREVLAYEQIQELGSAYYLEVDVEGNFGAGILMSEDGKALTSQQSVAGAFERKRSTVTKGGSFTQDTLVILPQTSLLDGSRSQAQLTLEAPGIAAVLLQTDLSSSLPAEPDFDSYPKTGELVWVCLMRAQQIYPEQAKIVADSLIESSATLVQLDSSFQAVHSGTPILSIHGDLVGMLMVESGRNMMLPMRAIRERAPLIYKQLQ